MESVSTTIAGACQATGLGRSTIYGLIGEGKLDTVKVGRRTLIKVESIRRLLGVTCGLIGGRPITNEAATGHTAMASI